MTPSLPKPIEIYLASENAHDVAALDACMAADAVVVDERKTMRGLAEIKAWRAETAAKYAHRVEPLSARHDGAETAVRCRVSGSFPGSAIELDFAFKVESDRIVSLRIG